MSEWVSVSGLTSHSTHNRSFRRRVFPGNQLYWYWQPKTIKHNTTYTRNTEEKQKKTALANKKIKTLIWYGFYYLLRKRSGPYSYSPGAHTGLPTAWKKAINHHHVNNLLRDGAIWNLSTTPASPGCEMPAWKPAFDRRSTWRTSRGPAQTASQYQSNPPTAASFHPPRLDQSPWRTIASTTAHLPSSGTDEDNLHTAITKDLYFIHSHSIQH